MPHTAVQIVLCHWHTGCHHNHDIGTLFAKSTFTTRD